jgi:MFS family permease
VQRGRVMSWIVTFICLSSLGTAVTSHVLALDGVLGFGGWRWVVIITGVPAIMMGVVCFRTLREDRASGVLPADERTWLTARLAEDAADDGDPHSTRDFFRPYQSAGSRAGGRLVLLRIQSQRISAVVAPDPQAVRTVQHRVGWVAALPALLAIARCCGRYAAPTVLANARAASPRWPLSRCPPFRGSLKPVLAAPQALSSGDESQLARRRSTASRTISRRRWGFDTPTTLAKSGLWVCHTANVCRPALLPARPCWWSTPTTSRRIQHEAAVRRSCIVRAEQHSVVPVEVESLECRVAPCR